MAPAAPVSRRQQPRPPEQSGRNQINPYLWQAAIETLSFMPVELADASRGEFVTGWFTPSQVSNERFKAAAHVKGATLSADALSLDLARQVKVGKNWVDVSVLSTTITEMRNKIMTRANELREVSVGHDLMSSARPPASVAPGPQRPNVAR